MPEQLQQIIQQTWSSVVSPQHTLDVYQGTDPEGREHLLFVVNGINQLRLYPLDDDWTGVEGHGTWNQFHYRASFDDLNKIAVQVVLILIEVLVKTELESS
jgi:hypothetical protein